MATETEIKKYVEIHVNDIIKKHMGLEGPFIIKNEYRLQNGQEVDRVAMGTNNKIFALFECKGEAGVNELIDGVGQALQGWFQIKSNLKGDFSNDAKSFLVVSKETASKLNLDDFYIPPMITLILVDVNNKTTVEYKKGKYIFAKAEEWVTINPYYFRDSSLEGIYFFVKWLLKNSSERNKKSFIEIENEIKKIIEESGKDFFGDVRNNHIVASELGFYDDVTKTLTKKGYEFAKKNFFEFCRDVVLKELKEYSQLVFIAILSLRRSCDKDGYMKISTKDIQEAIKGIYGGKKITYLFDPDEGSRNLLTIIRMLETIGAIKRKGNSLIKINYYPFEAMPFEMEKYVEFPSEKMKFWFDKFNLPF